MPVSGCRARPAERALNIVALNAVRVNKKQTNSQYYRRRPRKNLCSPLRAPKALNRQASGHFGRQRKYQDFAARFSIQLGRRLPSGVVAEGFLWVGFRPVILMSLGSRSLNCAGS